MINKMRQIDPVDPVDPVKKKMKCYNYVIHILFGLTGIAVYR